VIRFRGGSAQSLLGLRRLSHLNSHDSLYATNIHCFLHVSIPNFNLAMAERIEGISDTGFTLVYEPGEDEPSPVVDIAIVHGLQGHPFRTWAYSNPKPKPKVSSAPSPYSSPSASRRDTKLSLRPLSLRARINHRIRKSSSVSTTAALDPGPDAAVPPQSVPDLSAKPSVFWPRDMLPLDCPRSRVLVFGYDSKVTKYMQASTNKNTILSHGKDLLFALSRERQLDRPLILVAHSLGGIVVKEMLAQSSTATDDGLKNIVDSTSSVIFLGTPHRGSPGLAAVGEWARSFVGTLGMESNDAILNALSLKTTDLERAQESFSSIWLKHDFRVKTFQEGLGLTGVNISVFGNKVVPDHSSLIGDARERAETIQADHRDMCRFTGPGDPNYAKLSGELVAVYESLVSLTEQKVHDNGHIQRLIPHLDTQSARHGTGGRTHPKLSASDISVLKKLRYPSMNDRKHSVERPAAQTCGWLWEQPVHQDWLHNRHQDNHAGLLWLKGKPGAGKSTLIRELFRRVEAEQEAHGYRTAAFFFNAKGVELEHSPLGLFRSLLSQLLPHFPNHLRQLADLLSSNQDDLEEGESAPVLKESVLRELFLSMFANRTETRTIIFIDALDECDSTSLRSQAYLWRDITRSTPELSVCLSSRHFPTITVKDCPEIIVDGNNNADIIRYVDQRLSLCIGDDEPDMQVLKMRVLSKSAGVFLWVKLVMERILERWDEGNSVRSLLEELDRIPEELERLFSSLLMTVTPELQRRTLRLFQWAILATRPLRLYEWEHILGFFRDNPPRSLREWRASKEFPENSDQVEKQIRMLSKGLIEVHASHTEDVEVGGSEVGSGVGSGFGGAGSLEFGQGGNRIVQVIHESVREFFLQHDPFAQLNQHPVTSFASDGHLAIMDSCINYISISELDSLVEARCEEMSGTTGRPEEEARRGGVHSFGSAYSDTSSQGSGSGNAYIIRLRSTGDTTHTKTPSAHLAFESLKRSTDALFDRQPSGTADAIAERISTAGEAPDEMSICQSSTHQSIPNKLLEDYPALLSYAVLEIFSHARLAQDAGGDPTPTIRRFQDSEHRLWVRWLALAEDISISTGLLFYAADHLLYSWITSMLQHERVGFDTGTNQTEEVAVYLLGNGIMESMKRRKQTVFEFMVRHARTGPFHAPDFYTDKSGMNRPVLHELTRETDVSWIRTFLSQTIDKNLDDPENGPHINITNDNGETALHVAIAEQNTDAVAELLKYPVSTEARDSESMTPLHVACTIFSTCLEDIAGTTHDDYEIVKLLLDSGASVFAVNWEEQTPLHLACKSLNFQIESSYDILKLLLKSGASVSAVDSELRTPFHLACESLDFKHEGNSRALKLLLESGASISAADSKQQTPLHIACVRSVFQHESSYGIVKLLLESGVPVQATDQYGDTALRKLCCQIPKQTLVLKPGGLLDRCQDTLESGWLVKTLDLLLQHGADARETDSSGRTFLHIACASGSPAIIRPLIAAGADPAAVDDAHETPLHIAAKFSSGEAAAELIRHGVPITKLDTRGRTPLHYATLAGNSHVAAELLAVNQDQQTADNDGCTPLHLACESYGLWRSHIDQKGWFTDPSRKLDSRCRVGQDKSGLEIIGCLLEHGARVYSPKDSRGLSPFDIVAQRDLPPFVVELLENADQGPPPPAAAKESGGF